MHYEIPLFIQMHSKISFSDFIQIDINVGDHDVTSASLRIPYNFQAKS